MSAALQKEGEAYAAGITRFLNARDQVFNVERFKSRSIFHYTHQDPDGPIRIEIKAKPFSDYFSLFANSPLLVPEDRREWFLSLIADHHFYDSAMRHELNPRTGELRVGYSFLLCPEWVEEKRLSQMADRSIAMLQVWMGMLRASVPSTDHSRDIDDESPDSV